MENSQINLIRKNRKLKIISQVLNLYQYVIILYLLYEIAAKKH